jgi:hypothetical protein
MNYDEPRQRETDKRWDYTTHNKRTGTRSIGYCRGWDEKTGEKLRPNKDKFHTDGHETREEALECYRQYQLDNELFFGKELLDSQARCIECGEWTQLMVQVGYGVGRVFVLCEKHQNRETVAKHLKPSTSIHS